MRSLSLFLFIAATAMSATITLNSTCTSSTSTETGTALCNVSSGSGSGQAQASASFATSGNTLTFSADTSAFAAPGSAGIQMLQYQASASVALTAYMYTLGPARAGYVEVSQSLGATDGGVGAASISYSLGSAFGASCNLYQCQSDSLSTIVPIELGTNFVFTESQTASGFTNFYEYQGDANAAASLTFQFFEADGVTPVNIFDPNPTPAPEPSSWGLLALSLAAFLAWPVKWGCTHKYSAH